MSGEAPLLQTEAASMAESYLRYQRSRFTTRLPTDRLYAASHFWILRQDDAFWRIGFTKFAVRFLGEPVEYDFEIESGAAVTTGQVIGWMEGFKAVTDLFCPMPGSFVGGNPDLESEITLIRSDPYGRGWLYAVDGQPGDDCMDAAGYAAMLDVTIDKMTGRDA